MPKQDASTAAEIEIRALRHQSNAAIARHDVAAAVAIMRDDVRVISSHGSHVEGLPATARAFGEIFADAAALNARGIATARGGQWHAKSVSNILERV